MKNTPLRLLALAALAALPIVLVAAQGPGKPPPKPEGKEGKEGREGGPEHGGGGKLEDSMQILQGSTKRLDKALASKDMAAVLKLAVDMEKAVLEAKLETPPKAGSLTDAKEKDAFVKGFRHEMITLEKALLDLEGAALDDKAEDAAKIFNTTIKPLKKEGHDKYKGD